MVSAGAFGGVAGVIPRGGLLCYKEGQFLSLGFLMGPSEWPGSADYDRGLRGFFHRWGFFRGTGSHGGRPIMSSGLDVLLFYLFAGIACGGALGVALGRDLVRSAFCLMLSLAGVAGLFFQMGAGFLGAVQLLVYVGGTLVLLIFGVMLTSSDVLPQLRVKPTEMLLAAAASLALLGILLWTGLNTFRAGSGLSASGSKQQEEQGELSTTEALAAALVGIRSPGKADRPAVSGLAPYVLAFEVVSVHLVVVLIGAAYLARARWPRWPRFSRLVEGSDVRSAQSVSES